MLQQKDTFCFKRSHEGALGNCYFSLFHVMVRDRFFRSFDLCESFLLKLACLCICRSFRGCYLWHHYPHYVFSINRERVTGSNCDGLIYANSNHIQFLNAQMDDEDLKLVILSTFFVVGYKKLRNFIKIKSLFDKLLRREMKWGALQRVGVAEPKQAAKTTNYMQCRFV